VVLVADDDAAQIYLMRRVLENMGVCVLTAASGCEAMTLFEKQQSRIDAAVLDVSMPGISGFDVCRAMRSIRPDMPVVIVSGYGGDDRGKLIEETRPTAFLPKPFALPALRRALAKLWCDQLNT